MVFAQLTTALFFALSLQAANAAFSPIIHCPHAPGKTTKDQRCCSLFTVLEDIQRNMFEGGQCNDVAHEALRLTFHDAVGISQSKGPAGGGGADGSIMAFSDIETNYHANVGLDEIIAIEKPFAEAYNMTPGDFIHFAGAVAVLNCPGAPSLNYLFGRPPPKAAAPDGTVPAPFHTVDQILERMNDAMNFSPAEVVWSLIAHTVGSASDVDPSIPRTPFDSTPGVFDSQFFVETQLRGTLWPGKGGIQGEEQSPLPGEIRLSSDKMMARDSRTNCEWQSMVNDHPTMQSKFRFVVQTLSTLGQDTSKMVDCSDVLPQPKPLPQGHGPTLPVGKTVRNDIEQGCATSSFPQLPATGSPNVAPVPQATTNPPGTGIQVGGNNGHTLKLPI